ncbi:TPA: pyrroline-5-carboxylate reductase [Candidatus Micrarchaeota archaeon]|nr:pyrroline-5-carboxylate reductase [Candidatus Micrarchaeota archaeon]
MKQKTKLTVGIIGLGKMGSALAKGLVKKRFAVVGTDPKPAKIMGLKFLKSIEQVVSVSQVVLLCVKPKSFPEVLPVIAKSIVNRKKPFFISIAAGVKISTMEKALGKKARIARAMPNLCAFAGKSATGIAFNRNVFAREKKTALLIFDSIGKTIPLKEANIDAVTAVSGSGPAYFYHFTSLLAKAGAKTGLPEKVSYALAVQTFLGAAALLENELLAGKSEAGGEGKKLSELIARIATPGGTTEAALKEFNRNHLPETAVKSVRAAKKRAGQLSKMASK